MGQIDALGAWVEACRAQYYRPLRCRRNNIPFRPYRHWTLTPGGREAWAKVLEARHRARATVAREIAEGRWWVPPGFTVADLDAMTDTGTLAKRKED